ncbi:hypothetical protein Tco_1214906 [Tanacetum coccineum]
MGLKDLHNWYQSLGTLDLGSQVMLVYLVNVAKVNSWNVSTYNSTKSPTVMDQMAHYVAPVAFGSTWTIMMIVAFRTQRLGPAPGVSERVRSCCSHISGNFTITLTLEVSQTSTLITGVSSLIPSSSRIPTLPGYVANLLAIPALYSTYPLWLPSHLLVFGALSAEPIAFLCVRSGLLTYGPCWFSSHKWQ